MRDIKFRCYSSQKEMLYMADIRHMALAEFEMETSIKWMQYTGLKDVNGVDIYEGDIIKDDMGYNYVVVFDKYEFTLEGYYNSSMCSPSSAFSESYDFKVIGNIYEHPELIK